MGEFDKGLSDIFGNDRMHLPDEFKRILYPYMYMASKTSDDEELENEPQPYTPEEEATRDLAMDADRADILDVGNIAERRETFRWGSFGVRAEADTATFRYLKDISDSHLVHIIGHLISRNRAKTLLLMLEEARYRSENNIFVADYEE